MAASLASLTVIFSCAPFISIYQCSSPNILLLLGILHTRRKPVPAVGDGIMKTTALCSCGFETTLAVFENIQRAR